MPCTSVQGLSETKCHKLVFGSSHFSDIDAKRPASVCCVCDDDKEDSSLRRLTDNVNETRQSVCFNAAQDSHSRDHCPVLQLVRPTTLTCHRRAVDAMLLMSAGRMRRLLLLLLLVLNLTPSMNDR